MQENVVRGIDSDRRMCSKQHVSTPDTNTDAQPEATRIAELLQQNTALAEQNAVFAEQVKLLAEQVAELSRQLGENSSNSHKPPSNDGVGRRKSTRKPKRSCAHVGALPRERRPKSRRRPSPTPESDARVRRPSPPPEI